MPTYPYECKKCDFKIELNRKVAERDDLASVSIEHCPVRKKDMEKQMEAVASGKSTYVHGGMFITDGLSADVVSHDPNCELKRCVTSGSFTI